MGKLYDSLSEYFRTASKEQLEKDWEDMKHLNEIGPDIFEVINGYKCNQDLFCLTPEEVDVVYKTLNGLKTLTSLIDPTWRISDDDSHSTQIADNLLIRIKQWQDENNRTD